MRWGFISRLSFIYLGFYVAFNTVQVISRRVVRRAEETSTYSSSGFCTLNCHPMASNYQLSHLRLCREPNPLPQRWEARVLPLCHRGPSLNCQCTCIVNGNTAIYGNLGVLYKKKKNFYIFFKISLT